MISIDEPLIWTTVLYKLAVIGLELCGTFSITIGALIATIQFARQSREIGLGQAYRPYRSALGRSILLGLEFLLAGDILKSLLINPTLDDLLILAGLVLVRTFLSISLGVEINGHWPWQDTRLARESQSQA